MKKNILTALVLSFFLFQPNDVSAADKSPIHGSLDVIAENGNVMGWAHEAANPLKSIDVELYVDDPKGSDINKFVISLTASLPREDLPKAGFPGTKHGYSYTLPKAVRDGKKHTLYVFGIQSDKSKPKILIGSKEYKLDSKK